MELTIMLSKVFGIYLVVGGLAYMVRRHYFMSLVREFVEHRMLRMVVAVAQFIAGLFIIVAHNTWSTLPEAVVSAIGWLLVIEGAFYLLVPDRMVRKIIRTFNTPGWYIGGGLVSIAAGLYLVNFAFGIL